MLPYFVKNLTLPDVASSTERASLIMHLLASAEPQSIALRDATMATATTYFAHRRKRIDLRSDGLRLYVKALGSLNKSLSGDNVVSQDMTLVTVAMLAIRDSIIGEDVTNAHNAAEFHILRNLPLSSPGEDSRAAQIHSVMRIRSAIRSLWDFEFMPHLPLSDFPGIPDDFCYVVTHTNEACNALRGARSSTESPPEVKSQIRRVVQLEHQLHRIASSLSRQKHYSTITYDDPNPVSGYVLSHAHVFTHMHLARAWIILWCCRIKLLDVLAMFTTTLSQSNMLQFALSGRLQDRVVLASHICAAVPYMLDEVSNSGKLTRTGTGPDDPGDMLCLAMLYVTGCSSSISSSLRLWIIQQLSYIGNERGIGQAFYFMRDLHSKESLSLASRRLSNKEIS